MYRFLLDLYGSSFDEQKTNSKAGEINGLAATKFKFNVCDRLLNCGPVADITVGALITAQDVVSTKSWLLSYTCSGLLISAIASSRIESSY